MKRILHVIPTLDPGWSQQQLMLLGRGLARDGYRVLIVALHAPAEPACEPSAEVEVCTLGAHDRFDLHAWRRWIEVVRGFEPDVIHAWTPEAYRWAWLAGRLVRGPGLVVTLPDDGRGEPWRWRVADPWLLGRAARVIFNCQGVRDVVADRCRLDARAAVIASGVEPPVAGGSRAELLDQLGLPGDALLIGAAGQLRTDRRLKDLIWAADMLKFIRGDVHLLIVGDGPHRWRLERFTSQVRIEDKVHFLGRRSDWPRWLGALDVFWSARDNAGQPLALMEAMSCGLPVVATRVPGSEELIEDGHDGFLVPVGDRLAFGRATQKLLENPELRAQMGAAGRRKIGEQFSASTMIARVAEVYEDLGRR